MKQEARWVKVARALGQTRAVKFSALVCGTVLVGLCAVVVVRSVFSSARADLAHSYGSWTILFAALGMAAWRVVNPEVRGSPVTFTAFFRRARWVFFGLIITAAAIAWLVEGGFREVVTPIAIVSGGWAWHLLASITGLEWMVIIAAWLVWRELRTLRKLITHLVTLVEYHWGLPSQREIEFQMRSTRSRKG